MSVLYYFGWNRVWLLCIIDTKRLKYEDSVEMCAYSLLSHFSKQINDYDQEIPQSHTADQPKEEQHNTNSDKTNRRQLKKSN